VAIILLLVVSQKSPPEEGREGGERKEKTMTIYRCTACGKDVEVEVTEVPGISEIKPCEVCLGIAEEAVKEESYDKGYQKGWQAAYDTMSEEEEEEEEEDTGPGE
jgi:DNA-directed RNA polymerase subunit RPC12/RpoP